MSLYSQRHSSATIRKIGKKEKRMKKLLFAIIALMSVSLCTMAEPKVKFEKVSHNFGKFKKSDGPQTCVFNFTNTGDEDLLIYRAVASCGCTVAKFTKTPVKPGATGTISVEYNASRIQLGGHFKKSINVNTNGKPEMVRLFVEGDMEADVEDK